MKDVSHRAENNPNQPYDPTPADRVVGLDRVDSGQIENGFDASAIIDRLTAADIEIWLEGDALRYSAPQALTDEQVAYLRRHRPALIEALRPRHQWVIEHADGRVISHFLMPPESLIEVRASFPDAVSIEAEADPDERNITASRKMLEAGR